MSERRCACGCERSLDGMRKDAIWYSRACAVRWVRTHPGKSLRDAYSANKGRTRRRSGPSGAQGSLGGIQRSMELLAIRLAPELNPAKRDRLVEIHSLYALPARQREILEQRQEAA